MTEKKQKPWEDKRRTVQHVLRKYGGYRPEDRDTVVFQLTIPLKGQPVGLFGAPWGIIDVKWEWDCDKIAEYGPDQMDDVIKVLQTGLSLVFAGAERIVWEDERRDIIAAAAKTAEHLVKRAQKESK